MYRKLKLHFGGTMPKQEDRQKIIGVDTIKEALEGTTFVINKNHFIYYKGKWCFFPSAADKEKAIYLPRLWYYHQGKTPTLEIEYSLPKILCNNNFIEPTLADKELFLKRLVNVLNSSCGVQTTSEALLYGRLQRVDIGKNILSSNADGCLEQINACMAPFRRIVNNIQFENGGRGSRFQNRTVSLIIYDKLYDMTLPETLRLDKDIYCQKSIAREIKELGLDILRLEKQCNGRKPVTNIFKKYGIKYPVLNDIFNPDLMQRILAEEWNILELRYFPNIAPKKTKMENLIYLLDNNKETSLSKIFSVLGLQTLLSEISIESLRRLLRKSFSTRNISSFFKSQKKIKFCQVVNEYFEEIKAQINNWLPVQLHLASIGQTI